MNKRLFGTDLLNGIAWIGAAQLRPPRIAPLRGVGTGRVEHGEWNALLSRFVQQGAVDYPNFRRVRRLVEVYLSRLVETDPEAFADANDQIAFYLNAYNAIAIHQVLLHPYVASIREIAGAFVRPYPIGRRNLSLNALHGGVLRAFGDPRLHAAINPAARGAAALPSQAYTGATLHADLDNAMRRLFADARYDPAANTLLVAAIVRWFGGDFVAPHRMPSLTTLARPQRNALRVAITPYLPADLAAVVERHRPALHYTPFDWRLNGVS